MHNETDPRRRNRSKAVAPDRHAVSMVEPSPIALMLARFGLQLRIMRDRLFG